MGNCINLPYTFESKSSNSKSSAKQQESEDTNLTTQETPVGNPIEPLYYSTNDSTRIFHVGQESTYWLPKDDDEQRRLTGQHFLYKEFYDGSNILPSVKENLNLEKGVKVLDVGCGSCVWIMDMITDYPNCEYHGCDIEDITNKLLKLDKFTFTYGNVVTGLPYEDNTFDFIYMRLFMYALRAEEWAPAISEVIRVVKPGGMIQFFEAGIEVSDNSCYAYDKLVKALNTIAISRGQNINVTLELEGMLSDIDTVKIIQCDNRSCNSRSGTSTAKKFIWDAVEITKSAITFLKPMLDLETKEDVINFHKALRRDMPNTDCYFYASNISVQKL